MNPEVLAYPFLFIAIFFESFILVTLLSAPARLSRKRPAAQSDDVTLPTVAIVVPCWNEAGTVAETADSLLTLEYPSKKLELIFVDDGSTDSTAAVLSRYASHPQVRVIHKENGGKHTALNAGIASTEADIVGCLDADSFVKRDALREIIPSFSTRDVGAVTAAMSVHKPKNLLQYMQSAEYIFGITLRHAIASINGLYVTPGPFSLYRRAVVNGLGGFRYGHQTEDMEMALRIQRAGYRIENAVRAHVYTKTPSTLSKLIRQRTRWTSGFLRNVLGEYRDLVFGRRYGALGMLMLPIALMTIGSGVLLFFLMIGMFAGRVFAAAVVRVGIPISYSLVPHARFDWFYLPSTLYILLAVVTAIISISLIIVGKRLSQTPGNLKASLISYLLLYAFIVPLWLVKATTDVALGKQRNWRYQ